MNRLILSIAILGCLALTAKAQEKVDEVARGKAQAEAKDKIKLADANADAKLDLAEIRKARTELRKSLIEARADSAKTKSITDANKKLIDMQTFLAADVGNDYVLDAEEFTNFLLCKSEKKHWRFSGNDVELLGQDTTEDLWIWAKVQYDTDLDGRVSAAEFAKELKTETDKSGFNGADLDKDGALSSYEFIKYGLERFKEKSKAKIEAARLEFSDFDAANPDPHLLYKKKGRKWTHKSSSKPEGMPAIVTYTTTEVTEVGEDHALVLYDVLDKDKKSVVGKDNRPEGRIDFRNPPQWPSAGPTASKPTKAVKKCAAGQFDCWYVVDNAIKTWTSRKYPGLVIKLDGNTFEMELIEFHEGE